MSNEIRGYSLRVHDRAELSIKEFDERIEFKLTNKDTMISVEKPYIKLESGIDVNEATKIDNIIYHMHSQVGLNLWE